MWLSSALSSEIVPRAHRCCTALFPSPSPGWVLCLAEISRSTLPLQRLSLPSLMYLQACFFKYNSLHFPLAELPFLSAYMLTLPGCSER